MRSLILPGLTGLLLAACSGGSQTAENGDNVAENLSADVPAAADTSAIDAVTSEDANMAADAEVPANEAESSAENNASANSD